MRISPFFECPYGDFLVPHWTNIEFYDLDEQKNDLKFVKGRRGTTIYIQCNVHFSCTNKL